MNNIYKPLYIIALISLLTTCGKPHQGKNMLSHSIYEAKAPEDNPSLAPDHSHTISQVYTTERNSNILISLLNEVLKNQLHRPIISVIFLPPVQEPEILSKKQSIVDVLCQDEDGCQYIIEMQVANTTGFEERAQYYASKAFINQLNQGKEYSTLKEVIFLAFTDFSIFPEKAEYKSEHITLDKKTLENNLDKISFTFIDLVKFEEQRPRDISKLSLEEKFYYFLRHAEDTSPEELKQLVGSDEVLGQAYIELNKVYWTETELHHYESDEKAQRDNKAAMDYAREEGREEGQAEGRYSVARNMLKMNFQKSDISKATGLSITQIEALNNK